MNIIEVGHNLSIQELSDVERYLLSIIQRYFDTETEHVNTNIEYIITEAIKRFKIELNLEEAGVSSINGQSGIVTITPEDLGCEPRILTKKTAFNKDFGITEGTICKGNDTRLSDARTPNKHEHELVEVKGLSGKLKTIENALNGTDSKHVHTNLGVLAKIIYTGLKESIDLGQIETLTESFSTMEFTISSKFKAIESAIEQKLTEADTAIQTTIDGIPSMLTNNVEVIAKINTLIQQELEASSLSELVTGVATTYFSEIRGNVTEEYNTLEKIEEKVKALEVDAVTDDAVVTTLINIQDQLDGNITTYTGIEVPTLENEPAILWTDEETKTGHIGDIYYDETNRRYRFAVTELGYAWVLLGDTDASKALQNTIVIKSAIETLVENLPELDVSVKAQILAMLQSI